MHPHSGTDDYHRTSQAYEKGIPVSTSMFQTYTAPVPQKTAQVQPQADLVPWSSGLFDCFNDVGNCCITFWFPCITFGQIAEIVDRGRFSCATSGAIYTLINFLAGYACFYACFYRSKIRSQYSLEKSPCSDCLVHTFCEMCALCQEYRELKFHGFDMSIGFTGWHGNLEKQTPGVRNLQMVAPTQGGMTMSR